MKERKKKKRERITCTSQTSICFSLLCWWWCWMFPLLFLVVDSRIVDRYFFLSLGVDMSLSLVSFFSRQAAAKERKRNVTDQNYQKLRVASPAYINERRKERKEKKKFFFFCVACCTSNSGRYSGRRVLVLRLRLLAIQKWNEERKKAAKRAESHLTDFFHR